MSNDDLVAGRDYAGTGELADPIEFRDHVNYFVGFKRYCAQQGLDPSQRRSLSHSTPDHGDVIVDCIAGQVYFRVPPQTAYAPPRAWKLVADGREVGRVWWRGGTDVTVAAGPELTRLMFQALASALAQPDPAVPLDITMTTLRDTSGGAITAIKVPVDDVAPPHREPYQSNRWSFELEPAAILAATRDGVIAWKSSGDVHKAGGTLPSGEERWIQVFRKGGRFVLTITGAVQTPPTIIQQDRGLLRRSPLAKLFELLSAAPS